MTTGRRSASPVARAVALAIAIIAGLAFVALGLAVASGPVPADTTVAAWLRPLHAPPVGYAVDAVNLLGEALVWDPLLILLGVALWLRGHRLEAVILVAGVLGAEAGASVAKLLINRARPPGVVVSDLITQASYPSGHMTRAVVTSGLLAMFAWRRPAWRVPAVVGATVASVVMGVARIAVGEHWFTDVVGAAMWGVAALALIWLVTDLARSRLRGPTG